MTTCKRRAYFPRGLSQPEQGYRFSLDALLLASFARVPKKGGHGLDLGSGCGVVGLGLLLANPALSLHCTGVEIQEEMVAHARKNALELGFAENLDYVLGDVSSYTEQENCADFVLANPPYREQNRGRVNPDPGKARARFAGPGALTLFCKAATRALRDKAPFFMVYLPDSLPEALAACEQASLAPKRVRFVHGREQEPARIMLLEARKNGGAGLCVEPPLVLYEGSGTQTRMTAAALAFCPFLQCNSG